MRLADVVGHPATARLCARLIARDRLPHAILIEGMPGVGRRTLAQAIAQAFLCQDPREGDACGACPSCRLMAAGNHPDLVTTPGDRDAGSISVDLVRETVVEAVYSSPLIGNRRAFVLPAIERWHLAAANALLKALEEPPGGTVLVATTAHAGAVLRTIRSRTQLYRLGTLSAADIACILMRGGIDATTAGDRAASAHGGHRGLWRDGVPAPVEALRRLALEGFRSESVAAVMAALPSTLSPEGEAAGLTLAAEQRQSVRTWLTVLAQSMRTDLRTGGEPWVAERIQRILALQQDLARNIQPRQVVEAIGLIGSESQLRRA